MSVVQGFVCKINKMGPRTEPRGTPKLNMDGCENNYCLSSVRKVGSEPVEGCTKNP